MLAQDSAAAGTVLCLHVCGNLLVKLGKLCDGTGLFRQVTGWARFVFSFGAGF